MGKISLFTSCVAICLMVGTLCPTTLSFVIQSRTFYRTDSTNEFQLKSTTDEKSEKEDNVTRTSFGQAEASLIEEADRKRLDDMGDFDANPAVRSFGIRCLCKYVVKSGCHLNGLRFLLNIVQRRQN
jgi:hypothetical protein